MENVIYLEGMENSMRVLITGAKGFIGSNLVSGLSGREAIMLDEFDKDSDLSLLKECLSKADFVCHLAGANRPEDSAEYIESNADFTRQLLDTLKECNNPCPVAYSSSTQAVLDNPYGRSKKAGEEHLLKYAEQTGARVFIYRFPNVFGKWCRPNYNSVIATYCYNTAHNLPIVVNNPAAELKLLYIDDVVEELTCAIRDRENRSTGYCEIKTVYTATLGRIAELIRSFKSGRDELAIPDMSDEFIKKLYSTYLSYLPEQDLSYELKMNTDHRGSFTEFIKQTEIGQLSVNILKTGVLKGNHWHNTKTEKFLAVSGRGLVRLRNITSDAIIHYYISGEKLEVVEIPAGYAHNIENLGDTDLVVLIWANECYNNKKPDTYPMEV